MKYPEKKQLALIGYPLGHSVSPLIHRELGKIKGLETDYRLMEIPEEALAEQFSKTLAALDGLNVTLPYKTTIVPLMDSLSPRAALYGAVNTVVFSGGSAIGANTDGEGFLRSLKAAKRKLGGSVLIAGCGGAARMLACESLLAGADVTLAVRSQSRNKAVLLRDELCRKMGKTITIIDSGEANGSYDWLMNATPVGMTPQTAGSPFSESLVARAGAVFDAVYNPPETTLLQYAKAAGVPCLNGLPMLVWQAAAAEELWHGVVYTEDEVNRVIAIAEKELKTR